MKKKNKIMALFRYASIIMSLLSWYTTYQGFRNTVFALDRHAALVAMLASLAIQTALLTGVLKYFPIMESILKKYDIEKQDGKRGTGVKYFAEGFVVTAILLFSLAVSIVFSYISIVNNMYANDFAVNANIRMEQFMKSSVTEMEGDNEEYIRTLRFKIVEELEQDGEEIIRRSVQSRAGKYANTVGELMEIGRQDSLIELHGKSGVKKKKVGRFVIRQVTLAYVERDYKKMLVKNPELLESRFLERMQRKINDLNNSYYIDYCMYYQQYSDALKKYNRWLKWVKRGKEVPSLEEMKGLTDNCVKIENGLETLRGRIREFPTGGYAKNSTKELKAGAESNVAALTAAVSDLEGSVRDFINNSYGENSLSFAEIVSAFGSKTTEMEELERARDQMLEMQGIMLKGEETEEGEVKVDLREVTELMDNLEHYVIAVGFDSRIQSLKELVGVNYNIDAGTEETSPAETLFNGKLLTGAAVSTGSSVAAETGEVITITPEEWTDKKKVQLTEFTALVFDHPVNLYCGDAKEGQLEEYFGVAKEEAREQEQEEAVTYQEKYQSLKESAYEYRKSFLDTSDSEKAYNLLFRKEHFPYSGKAKLSLAFAMFLDIGAFAIGFLMYRVEKTEMGRKEKKIEKRMEKNTVFRDRRF